MNKKSLKDLSKILSKDSFITNDLDRIAKSADAGCYRKIPQIVICPKNEAELIACLKILHRDGIALTFRAAGTSLSGQAISDSVLLEARGDHWNKAEVLDGGARVRVQPGITGLRLNQILAPYGVKFGPDPASLNSAMVGGILANNASGMSCGVHANSYATLRAARIILADGTLLDTGCKESKAAFAKSHGGLLKELQLIREDILNQKDQKEKIQKKHSIKNTCGYGLNALVDFEDPFDILLHLMVGSEGTLGFISEACFDTIPLLKQRASSLVYFPNLRSACEAVPPLREAGIPAIEIMDRQALRAVENNPGIPAYLKDLGPEVTALLIDLLAENTEGLEAVIAKTRKILEGFRLERELEITTDPATIAAYWTVRKGVFPSVGGMRKPGTSVIIEDIAVAAEHLTEAAEAMRQMLDELDYRDAVIYGHVLDGNLHFIFDPDFSRPDELKRYENMIDRLTSMVVERFDGSLKAEHGTGLNMAPFVLREWGDFLYGIMKRIKKAFDPHGILNPDVIISDDPGLHLKHFKPMPLVDETVDPCIECGFCEINCLSEGYSLSARQRIVIQREIVRRRKTGKDPQKLIRAFREPGDASCAGDGRCALTCPLSIDTGALIKKIRSQANAEKPAAKFLGRWTAGHFRSVHRLIAVGLGMLGFMQKLLGNNGLKGLMSGLRQISGKRIPGWDSSMPIRLPQRALSQATKDERNGRAGKRIVYFPSCINQAMGPSFDSRHDRPLVQVTVDVLEKAGYEVVFPENMRNLCCGTPWESKGFPDIANARSAELETALLKASAEGRDPILCDTSPCVYRMKRVMSDKLKIYEPVELIHDELLAQLQPKPLEGRMAFHITCTSEKMGIEDKFRKVAASCCTDPVFPEEVGCCGFAGDKGFMQPELNSWALRKLKPAVKEAREGFSNSRTCEIGLSRNSGLDYKSVMYLLDRCIS
ncbi:MAG: 4Fe-4S ferredoxin [Bacteroidetes bacterium]|nr:MAG: 4Fe-4S ferredoxin [Bacteroidota bacterium]